MGVDLKLGLGGGGIANASWLPEGGLIVGVVLTSWLCFDLEEVVLPESCFFRSVSEVFLSDADLELSS